LTLDLRSAPNARQIRRHWSVIMAASLALGVAGLAACSWVPFVGKKTPATPPVACPIAAVLKPVANTVVFVGTEYKPLYVAWFGLLSDTTATCTVNGDTLHVALDNVIVAQRGPSARGNDVDLSYFVALTTPDQTILGKKTFSVHVAVPPGEKRGGVTDHVEVAFATGGRPTSDFSLLVGLQIAPEAVEFYKHYPGR
jgi:hypothetical protein